MASFPRYVQLVGHGFAGLLEFAQVDDSANIYHRFRHLAYIFGNWRRKPFVGIRIEFVKTIAILRQNIHLPLFPALPPGSKKGRTPAGTALK